MASYGMRGFIGIAPEVVWSTPVAATTYFEALSESLATTIERFTTRNIFGGIYEPDDEPGMHRYQGEIVVPAHPNTMGHLLKGVLGNASGSVVLSGFLLRTVFTQAQNEWGSLNALPSYTLEVFRDVTSSEQYTGVQWNTMALSVQPNQELRMTCGVIARAKTFIAHTTPTFQTSPAGFFQFDTCSVQLGGVGRLDFESLTFNYNNNLAGIAALTGSNFIAKIQRTDVPMVRLTGTIGIEGIAQATQFEAQSEFAITANMIKANSFAILIECPRCVFDAAPITMTGRGRVTTAFSAIARYHVGSGTAFKITLTSQNSY